VQEQEIIVVIQNNMKYFYDPTTLNIIAQHEDEQVVSYEGTDVFHSEKAIQINDEKDLSEITLEQWINSRKIEADYLLKKKLKEGGTYDGQIFDIDTQSQSNLVNLLTFAQATQSWPGTAWTTYDNKIYFIQDIEALKGLVSGLGQQITTLHTVWQTHKFTVSSLQTIEEVLLYDLDANW